MKLKYYLRGLGVGIVTTAIICSIANGMGKESLTTEQIIQKAQALGMVSQDDYNVVKNDLASAKKSISDLQNQQDESKASTEEKGNQESETNNTDEVTNETDSTDSDHVTTQETFIEGSVSETTVKFDITPGMSSQAVSNLLEEKGIIPDATDFNNYVVESGNVNNLQVGEYEVKSGESYDTIIGKLTGR